MSDILDDMQKAKECANIIKFQTDGDDIKYPNQQQARAEPNARLIRVFGIDNAFTNATENKTNFVKMTQNLMWKAMKMKDQKDDDNWVDLCQQATMFFEEYQKNSSTHTIQIAELTQYVVLKLSLCYLFDDAREALAANQAQFDDIKYIGQRINELWVESKGNDDIERLPDWRDEEKLHAALRRVTQIPNVRTRGNLSTEPLRGKNNPMNLLLPAYETMWRVVLRCFLEVCYRNAPNSPDWIAILKAYVGNLRSGECTPNHAFHDSTTTSSGGRTAEIVKEALRLYPPTRRVHRSFNGQRVAANIEECQRFNLLADPDPLVFRPERWREICFSKRQAFYDQAVRTEEENAFVPYKKAKDDLKGAEEKLGYMPFAYFCAADHAATKEFASKMIGMLVGVLCEGLNGKWEVENTASLPASGTPLDSGRAAYEDLKLRRET